MEARQLISILTLNRAFLNIARWITEWNTKLPQIGYSFGARILKFLALGRN